MAHDVGVDVYYRGRLEYIIKALGYGGPDGMEFVGKLECYHAWWTFSTMEEATDFESKLNSLFVDRRWSSWQDWPDCSDSLALLCKIEDVGGDGGGYRT